MILHREKLKIINSVQLQAMKGNTVYFFKTRISEQNVDRLVGWLKSRGFSAEVEFHDPNYYYVGMYW